MANSVYGLVGGDTTHVHELQLDTGTWVAHVPTGSPVPAAAYSNGVPGAWDGSYYFFFGTDRKLYRYDPVNNALTIRAGGVLAIAGSNYDVAMASDGARVWYLGASEFGYYSIQSDTFVSLVRPGAIPTTGTRNMVWDYADRLYAVADNHSASGTPAWAQRFDIPTMSWTAELAPVGSGNYQGAWFANNRLYLADLQTGAVRWLSVPGGGAWTTDLAGLPNTGNGGAVLVDQDRVLLRGTHLYSISQKTESGLPAGGPGALVVFAFTLPIQPVFQFLEADGATSQNNPEPVGGSAARFFGGQVTPIYTFALRSLYRRNAVQISVVPNPGLDITEGIEIAPSPAGPWDTVANLGPMEANQVTPYYLRITVPRPVSIGTKLFNLVATSS